MMKYELDFPNNRELKKSDNISFKIFVPSTRNKNIKITQTAFENRVRDVSTFIGKRFGGMTLDYGYGNYLYKK